MELRLDAKPAPPSRPDPLREQRVAGATASRREEQRQRCIKGAKQGLKEWPAGLLWLAGGPIKRRGGGP